MNRKSYWGQKPNNRVNKARSANGNRQQTTKNNEVVTVRKQVKVGASIIRPTNTVLEINNTNNQSNINQRHTTMGMPINNNETINERHIDRDTPINNINPVKERQYIRNNQINDTNQINERQYNQLNNGEIDNNTYKAQPRDLNTILNRRRQVNRYDNDNNRQRSDKNVTFAREVMKEVMREEREEFEGPVGAQEGIEANEVNLEHGNRDDCGCKKRKCPTGPTGPTGPPGPGSSSLQINGNTGTAMPNTEGIINILGSEVISTSAEGNSLFIFDNAYLTSYVVDSNPNNDANYRTLDAALRAAYLDQSPYPITILLRPGEYELLEDSLSNTKAINIIGASLGGEPAVIISGSSISWGNKSWYSVQFENPTTDYNPLDTYTLNNPSPVNGEIDQFRNCNFFNNYKLVVINEVMEFTDCFFYDPELKRDRILEVSSGLGNIRCYDCEFRFFRPSSSGSTSLIFLNAGTEFTQTLFMTCVFIGDVEANSQNPITFSVLAINNNQVIKFISGNFRINTNNNAPTPCYIFGSVNNTLATNINLFLQDTIVQGPENDDINIFLISNLWAQRDIIDSISIRGCELDRIRFLNYNVSPTPTARPPTLTQNIVIQGCLCVERSNELFYIQIGGNVLFNLHISNCEFISDDSEPVFNWFYALDGSTQNQVFLSLVSVLMFNTYKTFPNPSNVRWLTTDVPTSLLSVHNPAVINQPQLLTNGFVVFYSDAKIYNYLPASETGAGTKPQLFEYASISVV